MQSCTSTQIQTIQNQAQTVTIPLELANRIMELRRAGHEIITVMEEVQNQFGATVKRGRFSLLVSGKSKHNAI